MGWETATILGLVGASFLFLFIALFRNDETEKALPLKMIFITLSLGGCLFWLNANTQIINANNATINNTNISSNLVGITSTAQIITMWVFYLFLLVTVVAFLMALFPALTEAGKKWLSKRR